MNRIHLKRSQTLIRARQNDQFLLYVTKHRETLPAGTAKNSMSHRKMFVSALFKTVFHLIFNAKIMSILEITFGISFSCNDLDLTDIISKTENALSTAIYQSEVRQLKKTHQIYSTAICIDMFVLENSPNHPKRTPKPAFPTTNNLMSPNTPHQTPQHLRWPKWLTFSFQ